LFKKNEQSEGREIPEGGDLGPEGGYLRLEGGNLRGEIYTSLSATQDTETCRVKRYAHAIHLKVRLHIAAKFRELDVDSCSLD
jgi:hypothetical protein